MRTDQDVELLQRHTDAENAHRLDALATLTEDGIFHDIALGGRRTGHAGAAEYHRTWWDDLDVVVEVERSTARRCRPLNSAVNERRGRGFFLAMVSMMDILSEASPLIWESVKPRQATAPREQEGPSDSQNDGRQSTLRAKHGNA